MKDVYERPETSQLEMMQVTPFKFSNPDSLKDKNRIEAFATFHIFSENI